MVPCQTGAGNWFFHLFLVGVQALCRDLENNFFGGEIPNLDALIRPNDEPVFLWGEQYTVDTASNILLSEELAFNEVPDHGHAVFSS